MTVRFVFSCRRCWSNSIRPSSLRLFGDSFRTWFGFGAYRCEMCRFRFYLFKPAWLPTFVSMLDRATFIPQDLSAHSAASVPKTSKAPVVTAWDLLRQNRFW